jgi:hypothetical protein
MKTLEDLIHEYANWKRTNGLRLGSAYEHMWDDNLTNQQRAWLRDFVRRWEEAEEDE